MTASSIKPSEPPRLLKKTCYSQTLGHLTAELGAVPCLGSAMHSRENRFPLLLLPSTLPRASCNI